MKENIKENFICANGVGTNQIGFMQKNEQKLKLGVLTVCKNR